MKKTIFLMLLISLGSSVAVIAADSEGYYYRITKLTSARNGLQMPKTANNFNKFIVCEYQKLDLNLFKAPYKTSRGNHYLIDINEGNEFRWGLISFFDEISRDTITTIGKPKISAMLDAYLHPCLPINIKGETHEKEYNYGFMLLQHEKTCNYVQEKYIYSSRWKHLFSDFNIISKKTTGPDQGLIILIILFCISLIGFIRFLYLLSATEDASSYTLIFFFIFLIAVLAIIIWTLWYQWVYSVTFLLIGTLALIITKKKAEYLLAKKTEKELQDRKAEIIKNINKM